MKRLAGLGGTCVLLAMLAAPAAAQQADWRLPIETKTLDNGLTVVVSEDRSSPTVGVSVVYHVGMRLEPENRTGFAQAGLAGDKSGARPAPGGVQAREDTRAIDLERGVDPHPQRGQRHRCPACRSAGAAGQNRRTR